MPIDLRPRVIFWTPAGAVVLVVEPDSVFTGNVIFPALGAVPYDLMPGGVADAQGMPLATLTLHVPYWGDVVIPMRWESAFGAESGGTVDIYGLGEVPYTVHVGDPGIPADQLANTTAALAVPFLLLVLGLAFVLMRRK